jgi:LPS sulfotransferase NodH
MKKTTPSERNNSAMSGPPCWILASPRSGSNLLCELLNSTDLFEPFFEEHAYEEGFEHFKHNKLMICRIRDVSHKKLYRKITKSFPDIKFIHLIRKDIAKQAVSRHLCIGTHIWSVNAENIKEYGLKDVPYDYDEILSHYLSLRDNHMWNIDSAFLSEPERIFTVYYEDLIADIQPGMHKIFKFLGIKDKRKWQKIYQEISKTKQIPTPNPKKKEYYDRFIRELPSKFSE